VVSAGTRFAFAVHLDKAISTRAGRRRVRPKPVEVWMIEVENLSKVYVDTPAVDDLSFFVPEGQVLGLLGPNGAGKTTAMRMITAFLPPTRGRVVVAGIDLDDDPAEMRRHIGYLPENVPLYPEMRVEEYLRFRADIQGVSRSALPGRLDDVCERCLLTEVRHQIIGTLSKGFRQRVGLAGALVHEPGVLVLDEPTVGLDPNQIIKIRELITELGRDRTVVLSTHILPEVEQLCERVLIIDRGRIVADGSPDGLRARLVGRPSVEVELIGASAGEAVGALHAVAGVTGVSGAGDGRYKLEHEPDVDPREAVFRLAVERDWVLLGMAQGRTSLEDVFVRLTTREAAEAEEE
jgi:ABC-2 type transport system ATP-binding protein